MPTNKQSGFSLIETVLAAGITATVVLSLMALLPIGLDTLQGASARTSEARIRQSVFSNYKMLDWDEIEDQAETGTSEDFYFDDRGAELPESDYRVLFGARVWVRGRVTLPGDIGENRFLRRLEIRIADRPERDGAFTDPKKYRVLFVTVPKMEK